MSPVTLGDSALSHSILAPSACLGAWSEQVLPVFASKGTCCALKFEPSARLVGTLWVIVVRFELERD